MKNRILSLILIATFGIVGCSNGDGDYTPKPSAFYRITMPEKDYKLYDTNILPFTFEYPEYSQIKIKRNDNDVKFLDLTFPQFNGTVFLTYKTLGGKYLSDAELGVGVVDIPYCMQKLKEVGYDGAYSFEIICGDEEMKNAVDYFKKVV